LTYFDDGTPVLKNSIVLFLDLLGSRATAAGDAAQSSLEHIFKALNFAKIGIFKTDSDSRHVVTSFSDLIALGWPIREDAESEIGHTLVEASYHQFYLTTEGLLSRGGLTAGLVFMDEGFAFGPALAQAYEIERTRAKYPRIAVSPEVIGLVTGHGAYYGGIERSPYDEELIYDMEGTPFVNYLSVVNDGFMNPQEALSAHGKVIVAGLAQYGSDASILQKYQWLADYHNYWCRRTMPRAATLLVRQAPELHRFVEPSRMMGPADS
jgi:hypothetical protein